ncbi:sugar phosphate isomerase/epimerase [Ravibacter arvi]|uniref:Sugar phosphate isomerase/epimerase n=1 Tax=Ravibacter arvi TaxID=2051041 RepID=A0ABP8LSU1_9BACT
MNRRNAITALAAGLGSSSIIRTDMKDQSKKPLFRYSLNMSTIAGQKLGFRKELEIAAKAGFSAVEIWISSLQTYLKAGNTAQQTARMIADLGLTVENAIGFAQWVVNDDAKRKASMSQMQEEMDLLREVGCRRVACPPIGATEGELDLKAAAERYARLLEMGKKTGVHPQLELWGFSRNLSTLSDVMYVAIASGDPDARLLLDVYHLYKGGSGHELLSFVGKPLIEIFHMNDYPASPERAKIVDADRVFTGDGIAPITKVLEAIKKPGETVVLSLELFNKTYYAQDALQVAKTGLQKMKALADKIV